MDCGNWQSDSGTDDSGTSDGGSRDGSSTDGGSIVVPNDATLIIKAEGGFAANGTDTSVCTLEDDTYTFDVQTDQLTWKLCVIDDGGAKNSYVDGNRTLSSSEAKSLTDSVGALVIIPDRTQCGADKATESLEIDSPTAFAPEIFYDQFYHCQANDGKTYVDGLDDVLSVARGLAH